MQGRGKKYTQEAGVSLYTNNTFQPLIHHFSHSAPSTPNAFLYQEWRHQVSFLRLPRRWPGRSPYRFSGGTWSTLNAAPD